MTKNNNAITSLKIHENIKEKLTYFHNMHKIPNIIFHGVPGSGKKTIVNDFIHLIYNNEKERIKKYVLYTNCAHGGKGIKFIREELKFFAKMHIHSNGGDIFKTIILLNADKLTIDAQSALRRCIELFTHSTRFFIIVEDKYKLLKPILSRFCEIYIPEPTIQGKQINLYRHKLNETFKLNTIATKRIEWLKTELLKYEKSMSTLTLVPETTITHKEVVFLSNHLYDKGYSCIDLHEVIENHGNLFYLNDEKKYELLFAFQKIRKEFRNEKLLMFFILHFLFFEKEINLEKLSFT